MSAQSMQALAIANRVRFATSDLHRRLASRQTSLEEALRDHPAPGTAVERVLRAQRRFGRHHALAVLRAAEVPPHRAVGTLTGRQRRAILTAQAERFPSARTFDQGGR